MKKSERGFTIVELVIVIAVIAVLAAVLIPTFSSLIKKANLSADMQAVREMNVALKADEALHGKPQDVETVMQVLADAGFNSENWEPVTAKYQVFWYKEDNCMVLYNSTTAQLEYPTDYPADLMTNIRDSSGKVVRHFVVYNENYKKAVTEDLKLDSSAPSQDLDAAISSAGSDSAKAALSSVSSAATSEAVMKSLGIEEGQDMYVNAMREVSNDNGSGTYAAMVVAQVSDSETKEYKSSGEIKENLFYVSVIAAPNATLSELQAAQKQASEYVYTVFVQINEGKVEQDVTVLMPGGTVLDASAHEWSPAKSFSGYFGTTNDNDPVIINGAKLTSATSYSQTLSFDGSAGKYFVTGFFGAVYGETTIENVIFRNMNIERPASDFDLRKSSKTNSRNSIGIIGGVIDNPNETANDSVTNVLVRNIRVEDNVTITGQATAAGLIAYVGGSADKRYLFNGKLTIDGCHVSATVVGGLEYGDYGPCGGLIGFSCRAVEGASNKPAENDGDGANNEFYNIIIRDTIFDGTVKGYRAIGAAVGNIQNGAYFFEGNCDFSHATLDASVCTDDDNSIVGVIGKYSGTTSVVYFSTGTVTVKEGMAWIGADAAAGVKMTQTDVLPAYAKYNTVLGGEDPIGANNGIN